MIGHSQKSGPEVASKFQASIWNRQAECLPRNELNALQLARLRGLVEKLAAKVPFYKDAFARAGLVASGIKSLDDLRRCPLTTKNDLRDHYPFGLFAEPLKNVARIHASSGTKGKPTVVGYSKEDLANWAEVCARSLACAGVNPGDIVQNSYGYGLFTGGLGLHYGAEKLGATVVPASSGRTQNQILLLQDFRARALCCTPSYALNIGYTLEELSIPKERLSLEVGIFGAEPWTEALRSEIEKRLALKALDIYGLSEIMGPGVSMECWQGASKGAGLHVWEDQFLVEVINPETGENVPDGQEGELVFTGLTKEALPLLRYRTGDLSHLERAPCVCGRTMTRMARVRARLDDMLIIRGVNLFPIEVEKVLLRVDQLAPHYQLIVERDKALDTMHIQVELTDSWVEHRGEFDPSHPDLVTLANDVEKLLKEAIGLHAQVTLMKPRSIPRSEGKANRVIDRRASDGKTKDANSFKNPMTSRLKSKELEFGNPTYKT
jgi:phenylacetate-CoA ligase